MKNIIVALVVLTSSSAFAGSWEMTNWLLNTDAVQSELAGKDVKSMTVSETVRRS